MASEKNPYEKVIKEFLILLSLLFFAPFFLNVAFKAQRIYTTGFMMFLSYVLIFLATCLIFFTVYFGFKTFKNLLSVIFEDE